MKTKSFQNLLRTWIAVGSLTAFLGGWIILGHSGKPVELSAGGATANTTSLLPPLPTLAPLTSTTNNNNRSLQPLQSAPNTSFTQPRFRTRGS